MNEENAKILLEKIDSILRDFDNHEISFDYDFFGGLTHRDLVYLAKQLISDFGFNEDDYYITCTNVWYELD